MFKISGRIMWSRQLWRRLETAMNAMKEKEFVIKSLEAKPVIRLYNKVGSCLLEYEVCRNEQPVAFLIILLYK